MSIALKLTFARLIAPILLISNFGYSLSKDSNEFQNIRRNLGHVIYSQMKEKFQVYCSEPTESEAFPINHFDMHINAPRRATLAEARALGLALINQFLQIANDQLQLRPYLKTYPLTHQQLSLTIYFQGKYGHHSDGSIHTVFFASDPQCLNDQGVFSYLTFDPNTFGSTTLCKESYDEANKQNALDSVANPEIHKSHPSEEIYDDLLSNYREKIQMELRLDCWSLGGVAPNNLEIIGAKFVSKRKANLKNARKLMMSISEELLNDINRNEQIRPYLTEYPFSASRLNIHLDFVKKSLGSHYEDGSMHSVTLSNGKISYFRTSTEKQEKKLGYTDKILVLEEPFEVACQTVTKSRKSFFNLFSSGKGKAE